MLTFLHRGRSFQSTPPVQGATRPREIRDRAADISIHAPCAGGDIIHRLCDRFQAISIHAPCAGGDSVRPAGSGRPEQFQSTPPVQGATGFRPPLPAWMIRFQSTPPVQGATKSAFTAVRSDRNFNPRPLCRGRHSTLCGKCQ